ncbi:hypothetical protein QTG54_013552 [Skeletonema marinoi]|uniref:Uncharacterized protein n=1 Tax=Skeletonema marinoi TaxID=267567 RepID=A0AAD8XXS2_9STRA|nr:hypothetical protein QTG54_013552 [Skeletonema marinoi]|eukprot:scaffold3153_cov149-Skeletonema_marinoi.AAC.5
MGGCGSKATHLDHVDDSVHVMLKHDRKKRKDIGASSGGYKPRTANPALDKLKAAEGAKPEGGDGATGITATE